MGYLDGMGIGSQRVKIPPTEGPQFHDGGGSFLLAKSNLLAPQFHRFWKTRKANFWPNRTFSLTGSKKVVRTISFNYGGWIFNWALNILG